MANAGRKRTSTRPAPAARTGLAQVHYQPPGPRAQNLEVLSVSELRGRVSAAHLREPQRIDFHLLMAVTRGSDLWFNKRIEPPSWVLADEVIAVGAAGLLFRSTRMIDRELMKSYYTDEAEKMFKPIRTFMKAQGLEAGFVGKVGHPAELIAKEADTGRYDLVMMGSHGHGLLTGLVLGSVATKVLAACKVPLLPVR
jgi:nucleotide-binding universal stress UspA family protein